MKESSIKALGEPRRYELLCLMAERGYCVKALAARSGLTESAVSQHLKVLREADLVIGVKKGYYTHYTLNKEALSRVVSELNALLETEPQPCARPFYGCPESEQVRCRSFVPHELRESEDPHA